MGCLIGCNPRRYVAFLRRDRVGAHVSAHAYCSCRGKATQHMRRTAGGAGLDDLG